MNLNLSGKRALVTGGTRGIGRAIADHLAAEGAHVSICARKTDDVEAAVSVLSKAGSRAFGQAADVAQPDELKRWVDASARELGGIDIVVANASALVTGADAAAFRRAVETDLLHSVNLVDMALPWLEKSDAGAVVAIASISGVEDYGYDEAAYGATKAALLFYIKSLSRQLAPKNIRANVVSPGMTWFKGGVWNRIEIEQPDAFDAAMASCPMGRMANPDDIANAVVFLASAAAGYITGINLVVDGGVTRRIQN
jgi:NAD(P)-dependent dehydrogenase (short-subunit alcohol dehydrogenase family)